MCYRPWIKSCMKLFTCQIASQICLNWNTNKLLETIFNLCRAMFIPAVSKLQEHGLINLVYHLGQVSLWTTYWAVLLKAILPLMAIVNITYNYIMQLLLIGSVGGQGTKWWDEGKENILTGMHQIRLKDSIGMKWKRKRFEEGK